MTIKNDLEKLTQKITLYQNILPKIKLEMNADIIYGQTIVYVKIDKFLTLLDRFSPEIIYLTHTLRAHINSGAFTGKTAVFVKKGVVTASALGRSPTLLHYLQTQTETLIKEKKWKQAGFHNEKDYDEALLISIELGMENEIIDSTSFNEFRQSSFYRIKSHYSTNRSHFRGLGIGPEDSNFKSLFQMFQEFTAGKFEGEEFFFKARKAGFVNKAEYLDALDQSYTTKEDYDLGHAGDFPDGKSYYLAKEIGLSDYPDYQGFVKSKCNTLEDYRYRTKALPKKKKKHQKVIKEKKQDALKDLKAQKFDDFLQKRFTGLEKLVELKYMATFHLDIPKETVIEDLVFQLEKHYSKKIIDKDELKKWRRLRNDIIHEGRKITGENCERGQLFFNELERNLENLV